jgi:hypothetical protein
MSNNELQVWVVEVTNPKSTCTFPGGGNALSLFWCKTKEEADAKVSVLEGEGKSSKVSLWQAILIWDREFPKLEWIEV